MKPQKTIPETDAIFEHGLDAWWDEHQSTYPDIKALAIDLDGGSAVRSNRMQFIKRLAQVVIP